MIDRKNATFLAQTGKAGKRPVKASQAFEINHVFPSFAEENRKIHTLFQIHYFITTRKGILDVLLDFADSKTIMCFFSFTKNT